MTKSIMLVGVGGQGTILASKLLTIGLMEAGYDVKMSEIHGMSQRGGSVSSQVRFGERVLSPVIEEGGADILVAFEKMEALRWLNHLKKDGKVIVNDFEIESMPIKIGKAVYARGINEELKKKSGALIVRAAEEATKLGNEKVMNVILLGALIKAMDLGHISWEKIIRENVKERFVEINLKAIQVGMHMIVGIAA